MKKPMPQSREAQLFGERENKNYERWIIKAVIPVKVKQFVDGFFIKLDLKKLDFFDFFALLMDKNLAFLSKTWHEITRPSIVA